GLAALPGDDVLAGVVEEQVRVEHPAVHQRAHQLPVGHGHAEVAVFVRVREVAGLDLGPAPRLELGQEPLARAAQLGLAADLVEVEQQLGVGVDRLAHGVNLSGSAVPRTNRGMVAPGRGDGNRARYRAGCSAPLRSLSRSCPGPPARVASAAPDPPSSEASVSDGSTLPFRAARTTPFGLRSWIWTRPVGWARITAAPECPSWFPIASLTVPPRSTSIPPRTTPEASRSRKRVPSTTPAGRVPGA